MRAVYAGDVVRELDFAKKAAKHFAENPKHSSYTDGDITSGCLLALRWGLGDDCVLVLQLDESHVPTNYQNLVRNYGQGGAQ